MKRTFFFSSLIKITSVFCLQKWWDSSMQGDKSKKWVFVAVSIFFLSIIAFPLFYNLDKQPIRIWDESRLAMNAFEMNKDGNLLTTHFEGEPDMWNTKPPLMIWLQLIFIKVFGFNELSLRLPSAIAALATCILLVLFSRKTFRSWWPGVFAAIILVTVNGYVHIHATRTGDYDALLTLFTSSFLLSFYLYIETAHNKYLHLFFLGVGLAILTKSIQGLLFIPALAVYALVYRKQMVLLKNKWFYIDVFIVIACVATYYLLRESNNPGYLQAIWENELGGRYAQTTEENKFWKGYYFYQLRRFLFEYWFWLLPLGFIAGFVQKGRFRTFTIYLTILSGIYLLLISISKTKLEWYVLPVFPLFAFIIGFFVDGVCKWGYQKLLTSQLRWILIPAFCILLFFYPYASIVTKVVLAKEYRWDLEIYPISYILQETFEKNHRLNGAAICYEGYNTHLRIYMKRLEEKGKKFVFADADQLRPGDTVIANQPPIKSRIESRYEYQVLAEKAGARIYVIKAEKSGKK